MSVHDRNNSIDGYEDHVSDVAVLAAAHPLFASLLQRNGVPPLWRRTATFETLVRFILEQQVSLASAAAAFHRLEIRLGTVTADGVLSLSDDQMRADGFSRQKTGYVRGVATLVEQGQLDIVDIASDREHGSERLISLRGIGPWTAACFRLFVSGEPDVWPTGDRALYVSMSRNMQLSDVPSREVADRYALEWMPRRSSAAKMLWYDYLGGRDHVPAANAGFVGGTGSVPA